MTERAGILLDSNALIALAVAGHQHHIATATWLGESKFATCPITEGALVRVVARSPRGSVERAAEYLDRVTRSDRHEFWPDDVSYRDVPVAGVVGHKQMTDAYLAQLARSRRSRLATFDKALAALHSDVAELVPTA